MRAQIALKIYGDDTDTLRGLAESLRAQLSQVPGLVDLTVEKQVLIPQITVRLDQRKVAQAGLSPGEAIRVLQALTDGAHGAQIVDGARRYELVLRLPDDRRSPQDLARTLIDTPAGRLPVSSIATVEETDGPNQIGRENGRRRIVVYANTDGSDMGRVIADIRGVIAKTALPTGNFVSLEGQFQAQEQATQLILGLSLVSLAMMFLVLYSRYQSVVLAAIIMANIPLALIGSVVAMWIAGVSLSVASMVGFITLTGIATRNGILKISHYINLCKFEGETLRPGDDRARLAGAADARADDGAGGGLRADAAAAGRRRAGQGDPASGGGGDLRRAGQLDAARHAADAAVVLAVRREAVASPARRSCAYTRSGGGYPGSLLN